MVVEDRINQAVGFPRRQRRDCGDAKSLTGALAEVVLELLRRDEVHTLREVHQAFKTAPVSEADVNGAIDELLRGGRLYAIPEAYQDISRCRPLEIDLEFELPEEERCWWAS